MGSSDLDAHSFVPSGHKVIGIKAHCLEGLNDRLLGWRAFQSVEAGSWSRVDPGAMVVASVLAGLSEPSVVAEAKPWETVRGQVISLDFGLFCDAH